MSKLSELLNPTPNPKASEAALDEKSDHHDEEPPTKCSDDQLGSPTQLNSLESPLEALATAATSSVLMRSPTQPSGASYSSFGAPYQSHTSSHPTPSQSSPPLPLDFSRPPEHSIGACSPGLEQYHHSTSREIKASRMSGNTDDASRTLPPLRSLGDQDGQTGMTLPNEVAHDGVKSRGRGEDVFEPVPVSPEVQQVNLKQESSHTHDKALTPSTQPPELPQPIAQPSTPPLPTDHITETNASEVEVKAESVEHPSELLQATIQHGEGIQSTRASAQPSETKMEPTLSQNMPELKADASRQPSLGTEVATQSAATNPKPVISRKRGAPKSKVGKKGTASAVKPAAKKRKIDAGSANETLSGQRSGTPASSRASKTPAPRNRKQESVTPVRSTSIGATNEEEEEEEEEEDEDEDTELFCICRKPDDHTWMIACDGPCQDWFHGRCVGMDEKDGNLIDRYICPNCKSNGIGQTTWKPMCRLETCRDPARVTGSKPSKYCSDAHGQEYMRLRAPKRGSEETKAASMLSNTQNRKRRRSNYTDHFGNEEVEDDLDTAEDANTLRGGFLRGPELKTVINGVKSIAEFRQLGEGVLSPPRTASPDDEDIRMEDADFPAESKSGITYSADESQQLVEIAAKRENFRATKRMLDDRERFLVLVKSRAKRVLEELRQKETVKDICGFDARLAWSDAEFLAWRDSPEGQKALESRMLMAPSHTITSTANHLNPDPTSAEIAIGTSLPDTQPTNHHNAHATEIDLDGEPDEDEVGRGVCQKRRCERHRAWWKLQQQDVAFEKGEVRLALGRLVMEEKGVRERAVVRCLEER
ncbi:hypothetical protein MMC07_009721 [Pseudocyphellaria aurata]|nr:hypothetical protein [Pseudocyphellaria aurata]